MDVADQDFPLVLVVGVQRSGTTWVEQLLSAHPQIAAGYESNLFSKYLKDAWAIWWTEAEARKRHGGTKGLATYVTVEEWAALLGHVARGVFRNVLREKPGATMVAEKTPDHSLYLPMIRWLFPKAMVIHVVRDVRDVVASLLDAAGRPWGEGWAPADAKAAAELWVKWVAAARHDAETWPDFHHEVHYESLVAAGPESLDGIFRFLSVPLSTSATREVYETFDFSRAQAGTLPNTFILAGELKRQVHEAYEAEQARASTGGSRADSGLEKPRPSGKAPDGFYRKGMVGGWKSTLTEAQVETIMQVAGPLMNTLGIEAGDGGASVEQVT
jgi:hypothetical protein